jgi:hypothetical protein
MSTEVIDVCRATQVVPDVRYTDSELRTNLTLSPNSEWNTAFKVGPDLLIALKGVGGSC